MASRRACLQALGGSAWLAVAPAVSAAASAMPPGNAHYTQAVQRYGHFALGQPHEYARLVLPLDGGSEVHFTLGEDEVFEDLAPRPVRLSAAGPTEWLSIVSHRRLGARLVLFRLDGDRLVVSGQGPAIGRAMRWLNPVGVADLDGDGQAEVLAVITPHIGGLLRAYRRVGAALVLLDEMDDVSNHVYGSAELRLSVLAPLDGQMTVMLPDFRRRQLRLVRLRDGHLYEAGRCALPSEVLGPLHWDATTQRLQLRLAQGLFTLAPAACLAGGR